MTTPAKATTSTIIPALRYRDAKAAIDWLCEAFGFERKVAFEDGSGGIAHAELTFGNGMIMLGSQRDNDFTRYNVHPAETGGRSTQSAYLVVVDVDAHYARAKAKGAEIVVELKTEPHGRGYSCRDLEGHLWNFGDYDPWTAKDTPDA
jgi:uncharacterized glyoxalase superfamily protein PhnB